MKIILTGASGLIGSRFVELMFENHEIIPLSSKEVMIQNADSVWSFFEDKNADIVIHLAAKTDVDGCEADKLSDESRILHTVGSQQRIWDMDWDDTQWYASSEPDAANSAFAINFLGTRNIYKEAQARNMKFVYISTDFVFEGNSKYDEESTPNPINWYGRTKWYGEKLIDTKNDLIVRLSFPYGYPSPVKPDFVQKLIGFLRDRDEVSLIEDQTITPTFIDDIVNGLDFILQKNATGIYNLTGSSSEDPYHIGQMIKTKFGFNTKINPTTREQIYKGKAERPFQSVMKNEKIVGLGFRPKTFDEGLALIIPK